MLRYGIVGGGFITEFQLRALTNVRGVEVAGLTSRTPPEKHAAFVRANGLGEGKLYRSITEMVPHVDVLAFFGPNFTRVAALEEAAEAVARGHRLKGLIVEKPLARNLALRLDLPRACRAFALGAQPQHEVGAGDLALRAHDALVLDRVRTGFAQTGHIDEGERQAAERHRPFEHVARGPGERRGDGRLAFY